MLDFLTVSAAALLTIVALMAATFGWARAVGRYSVIDVTWGLGLVVVALVSALTAGAQDAGEPFRRWVLVILTAAWGLRLAWHILRRSQGEGEDPRYAAMLGDGGPRVAIRKVFIPQGAAMWVISLPIQAGMVADIDWWAFVWVGILVWMGGLGFEVIGDRQLTAYRKQPRDERPAVLDQGLWEWTRHPNYFGDALLWWGLWLIGGLASGGLVGLLTVLGPIAMTYFLRNRTGAKLLEQTMSQREGWDEYAARVPLFVPRPPQH